MNDTKFEDHLQRTSTYQRSFYFVYFVQARGSTNLFDSRNHLDKPVSRNRLNLASISILFLFFNLISASIIYNYIFTILFRRT